MDNEKMLNTAIDSLKELQIKGVEMVRIDNTKYDDGSSRFTIEVDYPTAAVKPDND